MNSSRCSKAALALALMLVAAVAPVVAVETRPDGLPSEARADATASASFEMTDLYSEYKQWTLRGRTDLTAVTWTVTEYNAADEQIAQTSYDGQSFNHSVNIDDDATRVVVKVTGTVPAVENFTYQPPERFLFAGFAQVREGGTKDPLSTYRVHHYTEKSKEARNAIQQAEQVVEDGGSEQAQNQLQRAINAYNSGNFDLAIDLANDARRTAEKAQQSQQRNQLILYGAVGVLALVGVVGGVAYWRSQQDSYDKLR